MAFTDRFVAIPVQIYTVAEQDVLGDNAPCSLVTSYVLPLEISEFYGYDWEDGEGEITGKTMIYMKSGKSFSAMISLEEFVKRVNAVMS